MDNEQIKAWASFRAPPMLLACVSSVLPPGGDTAVRIREMLRACVLAAPEDVLMERCWDVSMWQPTRFRNFPFSLSTSRT